MKYQFDVEEDNSAIIRLQVVNEDETLMTQADVETITLHVFETETATRKSANVGDDLEVASTIYDTAQSWRIDDTGFNMRVVIPAGYIANGGKTYRVELVVDDYKLEPIELKAVEMYSS